MSTEQKLPEARLMEILRTCWMHDRTRRCLVLKFSQYKGQENWKDTLTNILETEYRDDCDEMVIGHDDDVYIISRTMTKRRLQQFLAHLAQNLTPALETGLAVLFEVGVHWPMLRALCQNKLEQAQNRDKEKNAPKRHDAEILPAAKSLEEIPDPLIRSIGKRRTQRAAPEIMIVEDDKFSQRLVNNVLSENFPLFATEDGKSAIQGYVNKTPDVLFLDIGLPDMDGLSVLKKIFELDPDAYVVMLSGNSHKDNIMKAMSLGAKGFVGKPFTREKLLQYIEKSPFIQAKRRERASKEETPHESTIH